MTSKKKKPARKPGKRAAFEPRKTVAMTDRAPLTPEAPSAAAPEASPEPLSSGPPAAMTRSDGKSVVALAASLKEASGFYFAPSQTAIEGLPAGGKIESISLGDEVEGNFVLKLAGGDPSATSHGATQGFSIRVPDSFEREASERNVRVRVLARSAAAAPTRMAIAYSTNEVGNSGWRWLEIGSSWEVVEFNWGVPKMHRGHGDFVGLLPDRSGSPEVQVHSLCATIY